MRHELKDREGLRGVFTAVFRRFGARDGWNGHKVITALFVDVRDESREIVADHIWMTVGIQIRELKLVQGDRVAFLATVKRYVKGYQGRSLNPDLVEPPEYDFGLSRPTGVRKLGVEKERFLPLFGEGASDAM